MAYVDGFLAAVPKSKLDTYKQLSRQCEPIWREFGAINYVECAGDDTPYGELTSFPRATLNKLAAAVTRRHEAFADPKLQDVLDQIELRAHVELAKLEQLDKRVA